jgi:hypothetical protein
VALQVQQHKHTGSLLDLNIMKQSCIGNQRDVCTKLRFVPW